MLSITYLRVHFKGDKEWEGWQNLGDCLMGYQGVTEDKGLILSTENKWMLRNLPSAAYNDIHDDDYYTADDIVQHRFEDTNRNWWYLSVY